MRRAIHWLLAPALAAICMLGSGSGTAAQTTLIYGEAGPNRGARADAVQWFADRVGALSGGDLRVDVTWGGALFSEKAAVQSLSDNVADLGTVIAVYFPREMVAYGIADLPLDNPDAWVGMRAIHDLMRHDPQIGDQLARQNLVYIGSYTTSGVQIGCAGTSVASMADIRGKRLRGVGAYGKVFRDLGANIIDISVYEAYQGLETGLIDCTQTYPYLVEALKFDEVFDSFTFLNWGQIGGLGILMNKDAFDALPPDQQAVLLQAGDGLADAFGRMIDVANDASVQKLRDKGIPITVISPPDRAQLVAAGQRYVDEWVARADDSGLDGRALLDSYRALIARYTGERDTKGYPWTRD